MNEKNFKGLLDKWNKLAKELGDNYVYMFDDLVNLISIPRLTFYMNDYIKDEKKSKYKNCHLLRVMHRYEYNCILLSKLYIVLHFFEVTFRNTCCKLIFLKTDNEKWYLDKEILEIAFIDNAYRYTLTIIEYFYVLFNIFYLLSHFYFWRE
jgi:hypothetical protein